MNKKTGQLETVELQQLVSQPECLKLLILHTPFMLNLSSLPACSNLVKLDLSRNNLSTFPYLGELRHLKFLHIHENKLEIDALIGIFTDDFGNRKRSPLCQAVVWVTFWGNKGEFAARHFLANSTAALAVDLHMIVDEERKEAISRYEKAALPFSPLTNLQTLFHTNRKFNKNASEQEYMADFWEDMAQLRKKWAEVNPIVKIQRVWRGWRERCKRCRDEIVLQENQSIKMNVFYEWRKHAKFTKKLNAIFAAKDKSYLLLPIKEMKIEASKRKVIQFCQMIKKRILLRKMNLRTQYRFYNALKSNMQGLRALYEVLNISKSSYLMIPTDSLAALQKYIIPTVKLLNSLDHIEVQQNYNVLLRYIYEPARRKREFIRILQVNEKSIVMKIQQQQDLLTVSKKGDLKLVKGLSGQSICKCEVALTKFYRPNTVNFNVLDKQKMQKINKSFEQKRSMNLSQLVQINGSYQVLKDLVRLIYFYNMGYLTQGNAPSQKINFLSEFSINKMSSILKIQKMWRSRSLRKKLSKVIKLNFTRQRAAMKIQRWFRSLSWNHRKIFMITNLKSLKNFGDETFYVKMNDYMEMVASKEEIEDRISFAEQYTLPFIDKASKRLTLSWDFDSKSQAAKINHRIGKPLFSYDSMIKVFGFEDMPRIIKFGEQKGYEKVEISHLFHFGTQVSIVSRRNIKYLQICCKSKNQCRLRVLGLKLLTYKFGNKHQYEILPKELLFMSENDLGTRKALNNDNFIFISENEPIISETTSKKDQRQIKNYDFCSKFYINTEQNQKPIKFVAKLKIISVIREEKQRVDTEQSVNQMGPTNLNQKFELSNFLISETSEIKLDNNIRQTKLNDQVIIRSHTKKSSLKNIKMEKRLKLKNREKTFSGHFGQKDRFNFMLDNAALKERVTTQPDYPSSDVNMGSVKSSVKIEENPNQVRAVRKYTSESSHSMNRRNESQKSNSKRLDSFTKNFINQGNFIQKQFLYGQIKRLKVDVERSSVDKVERIRTQENEVVRSVQKFKDEKVKRAQQSHQRHKGELYRSVIEKKIEVENRSKKHESKQLHHKSLPKRMRINFAEECYPIIGKRSMNQQN